MLGILGYLQTLVQPIKTSNSKWTWVRLGDRPLENGLSRFPEHFETSDTMDGILKSLFKIKIFWEPRFLVNLTTQFYTLWGYSWNQSSVETFSFITRSPINTTELLKKYFSFTSTDREVLLKALFGQGGGAAITRGKLARSHPQWILQGRRRDWAPLSE